MTRREFASLNEEARAQRHRALISAYAELREREVEADEARRAAMDRAFSDFHRMNVEADEKMTAALERNTALFLGAE